MCNGSEAGSYLRSIDSCITQLKAQGPFRTCDESKEETHCAPPSVQIYLTECIYQLVLEIQLPRKIVNLLFAIRTNRKQ